MNDDALQQTTEAKTWTDQEHPKECDLCHKPIATEFVDGKTTLGPWAYMCMPCFSIKGVGLGVGKAQLYKRTVQ